jgi:putative oxidoreductase
MSSLASVHQVWAPRVLSIVRFVAGLCFFEHGLSKLFGFPHVPMFDHLHLFSLIGLQGVIELVGGALVCVGLFTRPAAFILSGNMAVAYFMAHFPKNFFPELNGGDSAILYCFIFFYIFFAGPGPWSLDYIFRRAVFPEETPLVAGSRRA